jgi:hypothetical protein
MRPTKKMYESLPLTKCKDCNAFHAPDDLKDGRCPKVVAAEVAAQKKAMPTDTRERVLPLERWLARIGAVCHYEVVSPNKRVQISVYGVAGKHGGHEGRVYLLTVHRYFNEVGGYVNGWEVFVPARPGSNHIGMTLDAAAEALGLDGAGGLVDGADQWLGPKDVES